MTPDRWRDRGVDLFQAAFRGRPLLEFGAGGFSIPNRDAYSLWIQARTTRATSWSCALAMRWTFASSSSLTLSIRFRVLSCNMQVKLTHVAHVVHRSKCLILRTRMDAAR